MVLEFANSNPCAARTSAHEKGLYWSKGRPNAEGRFDTSAPSLTNSMTWIPLSTSVCCSLSREARRGEFPIARYPVACPCFFRVSFFSLEEERHADCV